MFHSSVDCTLQYDNFMAVIELNLPNSQMNSPKWENAFKMNTDLQKFSPIWESALPFGRKSPKLSVRPYCTHTLLFLRKTLVTIYLTTLQQALEES